MVEVVTALRLLGGGVLLFGNGFFVTTEFALTRVRQFTEEEFSSGGLARAWEMTEQLEIFLSGCQVGITICSVGLGVVAEPAVAAVFDPGIRALGIGTAGGTGHTATSVILALALINLLHVVIGEQAPTYLGIERTKFVARYGAPPLYWWTRLMYPIIVVADRVAKAVLAVFGVDITRSWTEAETDEEWAPSTRGELRQEMGDALRSVGVTDERQQEVINALEIGDMPVEEIMIDRDDIIALSTTVSEDENLQRIRDFPHVRFPLVGEDLEEFRGIVYTPAVLQAVEDVGDVDFEALAAPPMTVSASTPVSDLIDRFQTENQELALVLEGGEVIGLATVTDAFEAITGEFEDPLNTDIVEG